MSQVQPSRGPGQRPATGGRRPPAGKPKPGAGSGGRSGQAPGRGGKGGGGGRGPRPGTPIAASGPRRFAPSTVAFAAVAVVVLVVVALVAAKLTSGGSNTANNTGPQRVLAPPGLVAEVTSVPANVAATVGVPSGLNPPSVAKGQPPLTFGGKPGAFFVGGEFCPYCAAERWAIVMAFSKFGTFSNLKETESSPWDVYPDTATFSFYGASYTSPHLTFYPVENVSNDTNGSGTRHLLVPLTSTELNLYNKYETMFGGQQGSVPFMDIGNKVVITTPSYNPQILAGLSQDVIAAKLSNPQDPVTQAIVGTANYLTAAICAITGGQPGNVCTASGTTEAAQALKLS